MNAARTRIGRVKFKQGGPNVRVLERRRDGIVLMHLRESLVTIMNLARPPDAHFLVTLRFEPETPGSPAFNMQCCSSHDGLPMAHLAEIGAAILKMEASSWRSEVRTLRSLGVEPEEWDPETA
jgi:hypothetical protein